MAAKETSKPEISSLEDILEANLPDKELAEAKRILYGRSLEWDNQTSIHIVKFTVPPKSIWPFADFSYKAILNGLEK